MAKFKGSKKKKKHEGDSRIRRRNALIAIAIGVLFIFSIFGIALQSPKYGNTISISNLKFIIKTLDGGGQYFELIDSKNDSLNELTFYYLPDENYKSIFSPNSEDIRDLVLNNNFIYLSLDPSLINGSEEEKASIQYQELSRSQLRSTFEAIGKLSFNSVETPFGNSMEFGCENATDEAVVISFVDKQRTEKSEGIYISDKNSNCLEIVGSGMDFVRYTDLLKFLIISTGE